MTVPMHIAFAIERENQRSLAVVARVWGMNRLHTRKLTPAGHRILFQQDAERVAAHLEATANEIDQVIRRMQLAQGANVSAAAARPQAVRPFKGPT